MNGYIVKPASAEQKRVINPRRGPSTSVPLLSPKRELRARNLLFSEFGLTDYLDCVTAEMSSRPVPHVFKASDVQRLTDLYTKWAPRILAWVFERLKPSAQSFNRTSRLGWPDFNVPDSKAGVLIPRFEQVLHDGLRGWEAAYTIMNVRLQPEPKQKKRDFLFVGDDGQVSLRSIGAEQRMIKTADGDLMADRTRLVFNLCQLNLYCQMLDTCIHNVLLTQPVFHHDLHKPGGTLPIAGVHRCFDIKHMERYTSEVCRVRASQIGGRYHDINELYKKLPFLCPSESWKKAFFLWVNREDGWTDQFASGNSAVAPAQKECFLALYSEFCVRRFSMTEDAALLFVLSGGDNRLTIRNYGDDNSVNADSSSLLDDLLTFLQDYLAAEIEDPPKFLGFIAQPNGTWRLSSNSYLLKTYLNERRPFSNFRRYPCFGWVAKRRIYAELGDPILPSKVFPREDVVLQASGLTWQDVLRAAIKEEADMKASGQNWTSANMILEKDYKLTHEEKMATGLFDGVEAERTVPYLKDLIGERWHKALHF